MTAISELTGRNAPARSGAHKSKASADGAPEGAESQGGDFAALVKTARGKAEVTATSDAAPARAAPVAVVPAVTPTFPQDGAVMLPAAVADETAPPTTSAAANPANGVMAGEPDSGDGKVAAPRGRRGRSVPVEGDAPAADAIILAKRGSRGGEQPLADLTAVADQGDTAPQSDAESTEPLQTKTKLAETVVLLANTQAGEGAPVAPITAEATAAASSLVALVAAQQAATPALERKAQRSERQAATASNSATLSLVTPSRDREVPKSEQAASVDAPASRTAPPAFDPTLLAAMRETPAERRSAEPAASVPRSTAALSRGEAIIDLSQVTAIRMAPLSAAPVTTPDTAAAISNATIDMSVDGQWIDRMAREITQLAEGTGQSRFQLLPPQLGRIQVELAVGSAGTMVRMTAETDEAADRLRAGSNQLQADARLASIPLVGIVIDRASAGGFDLARDNGQNAGQNQQSQSAQRGQQDVAGQSNSQSGASQGEGRHKAAGRETVLNDRNEAESRPATAPQQDRRVRFA
jgi:flagellar hook-length control protein FliK